MKIQDQVITLAQAKKLKELGVVQESIWMWIGGFEGSEITPEVDLRDQSNYDVSVNGHYGHEDNTYAAFTVAELLHLMPDERWAVPYRYGAIDVTSDVFAEARIILHKWVNGCEAIVMNDEKQSLYTCQSKSAAISLADMLIYLLENGLIAIDYVNQRLQTA